MKPTRKRLVSILLLVTVILGIFAVPTVADEHIHIGGELEPQDNAACVMCGRAGMFTECQGGTARSEVGTHQYGLLWQDTCEVVYGYCYSRRMCGICGYIEYENRGPHWCFEYHRDCGDGYVSVCGIGWDPGLD